VAAADGVLRHLREQRGVVAHQQGRQGAAAGEGVAQVLGLHAQAVAGRLHHRAAHGALAFEQRHADHAFMADHGDLGGGAVLHHIEQRDDGGGGEVHIFHGIAELEEFLAERQLYQFQMFKQGFQCLARQRGQQFVLLGAAGTDHRPGRNLVGVFLGCADLGVVHVILTKS